MSAVVSCPACRKTNTLDRKFDAWARYAIEGVTADGELLVSDEVETQVFDDNHIECWSCGKEFSEDEIIAHLEQLSRDVTL
jgi:hypothetical protein